MNSRWKGLRKKTYIPSHMSMAIQFNFDSQTGFEHVPLVKMQVDTDHGAQQDLNRLVQGSPSQDQHGQHMDVGMGHPPMPGSFPFAPQQTNSPLYVIAV